MAILVIIGYLSCLALTYHFVSSLISFRRNLHAAKQTGLPYIIRPIFELNYFYFLLQPTFHYVIENIPEPVRKILDPTEYLSIYRKEWRFYVKYDKHRQLGDAFFIVSPGMLLLEVADADLCVQITGRRLDFVKPGWAYAMTRTFGRNIVEADQEDIWKRHRRVVAPQYSDTIHSFVWDEATTLGKEMFSEWHKLDSPDAVYKSPETSRESRDLNSLAIRVIMAAAFGISIPFRTNPENTKLSAEAEGVAHFADSMRTIIGSIIPVMLFPRSLLQWTSPGLTKSLDHVYSYLSYVMHRGLEKSTQAKEFKKKGFSADSILNGLTKALAKGDIPGESELSQSEVIGNMFMISVAGSGTTADSMHFGMIMLALYQDIQDWAIEELDGVVEEFGDDWKYQKVFPKLVRISSIMMETLRFFPPVVSLPKWTDDKSQTLNFNNSTFVLPPQTLISLSGPGLHYNPKWWGKDAAEFRPQRWLSKDSKTLCSERVDGSFVPFSRGARGCLGKRFSEAEFVAIISVVLRNHRIELVVEEGETLEIAQEKARFALKSSVNHLSLHVGGKVPLRFVKRK